MRKFTGIVLSLALIFAVKIPARAELAVSAKAAILMHADSGRVLYEKNADEHMLIASTTKIMTAIVVLEHCELDDLVEVDSRSAGIEGSSMYLKAGESYTVEDLLYGLLLASLGSAAFIALRAGAPGGAYLLAGGCLFLCSDGILSFETFRDGDSNAADVAVMLTYIAAQTLLAIGFSMG